MDYRVSFERYCRFNYVRLGEGATNWQSMVQALNSEVPVFLEYGVATDEELNEEIQKVNLIL